jgi:hypothetical protein
LCQAVRLLLNGGEHHHCFKKTEERTDHPGCHQQ